MTTTEEPPAVLRYAAFAATPEGGNPAGIVLSAGELDGSAMQGIAAEVGYAETAFVTERDVTGDPRRLRIRFFSPVAEVPFCGHATIATAIALAEREGVGTFVFDTPVGPVVIETTAGAAGIVAAFTSVEPELAPLEPEIENELLSLLGLMRSDLDARYPLRSAFAGNWHPIVVVRDRARFDGFTFDPASMRTLMDAQGWQGTVSVLHATTPTDFAARNLFPVGTLTEDPATGSAAASLGGYLRATGSIAAPATVVVHQGEHVGRPSLLTVEIPRSGGIVVSGSAVTIA
ncbi:PhzF family phenazine biosynthesis protein [Cryobacterium sp. PH31-AA6]|uniref:PhzF family phenazine biosynthesis protein n=1 Tax=Cryobacterium sp. PH31-AA6 TaxID=3046205 RepID=UPI0024B9CC50|nr:PhzF family phenazine biosynthesis protein [Cryobacterium sp. PH31-AA6]MDJ0323238.1 PhzF family phenazine biosynthesis protein [Cryobacterium sp. PH31-AA6]